ncbi:uncharacterized protein N7473_005696 [Penicillium subrubescens]|uniref:uncharacterized protein n=1 Tax=Penicillium subrubescens TaxID=1316194 RepID=UPI002544D6D6|nr:uncharacterized protein N7473_005696 [Penicillium subrubescens]KAJ5896297.1 hypothetical protein N7473_005696 [Penicillium subrubescens]
MSNRYTGPRIPPHSLSYGQSDVVPVTTGGAVIDRPPRQLATTIKRLQFSVAQQGTELKSELLKRLDSLPARREPVFRASAPNTPNQSYGKMTRMIANVEASLMQVFGTPPDKECLHCRRSNGIFHQCILVPSPTSAVVHTDDASLPDPTNDNPPPYPGNDDSVNVDPPTSQAPTPIPRPPRPRPHRPQSS